MKFIAIVLLCISAAQVKAGLTKEEILKTVQTISAECAEKTGASEADIEVMMKCLPAENKETKCLRACMMKKFNVMNDDGKFVKELALKMAELHTQGDPKKMQIAVDVANACNDIAVPDDHCEAAEVYKMCMTNESKKYGFDVMAE